MFIKILAIEDTFQRINRTNFFREKADKSRVNTNQNRGRSLNFRFGGLPNSQTQKKIKFKCKKYFFCSCYFHIFEQN